MRNIKIKLNGMKSEMKMCKKIVVMMTKERTKRKFSHYLAIARIFFLEKSIIYLAIARKIEILIIIHT